MDTKNFFVAAMLSGKKISELALLFPEVPERTRYRWFNTAKERGSLTPHKATGRP